MTRLPDPVQAGQPITAAWANEVVDAAASLPTLKAGDGLSLLRSSGGVTLLLARSLREFLLAGIITAVQGADGDLLEDVTYDAAAIGMPSAALTGATPRIGRLVDAGARIQVARVNDPCILVRVPTDEGTYTDHLWILTEVLLTGRCQGETTTPGDGSGTGTGDGTNPPPPPPPPPPKDGGGPTDSAPDDGGTPTAGGGGGGTS